MIPRGVICSVDGCGKQVVGRNLCSMHYKRFRLYGDLEAVNRPHDWGQKEKHPMYSRWCGLRRFHGDDLCELWKSDFWQFVDDVGAAPEGHRLCLKPGETKYNKSTCYWKLIDSHIDEKSRDSRNTYQRKWRDNNPRKAKNNIISKKYGINIDEYEDMYHRQDGACAICGEPEKAVNPRTGKTFQLAVDHCHTNKHVRALLCHMCNKGLGHFFDNQSLLQKAIDYLKSHSAKGET